MKYFFIALCLLSTTVFAQANLSRSSSTLDLNSANTNTHNNNDQARGGASQFCNNNMLLNQEPNQTISYLSDLNCDQCTNGPVQVLAENFTLISDNSISELVLYGDYSQTNTPFTTDIFTVNIHNDNTGVPGAVLYSETDVSTTRTATGAVSDIGLDEYRFLLTLASPIDLEAGIYWIEIHNDSTGNTEDFGWVTGNADTNTIPNVAGAFQYPVVNWINAEIGELAFQVCGAFYAVDVNVTGLAPSTSVSFSNGSDTLTVNENGTDTLSTLDDLANYNVILTAQPESPSQICSITSNNASGVISGQTVTVDVNCVIEQFDVNLNVSGLAATNSVSFSNGVDTLSFNTNETQTISTLDDESAYDADITTQPDTPNQVCSFDDPDSGTLDGIDVTIDVICVTTQYTVGVDVSGLATGNTVVLQNNGGDDLTAGNGISTFAASIDDGSTYNVTVLNQPTSPSQTCAVNIPSGTVISNDIELAVTCVTDMFDININVVGLAASNSVSFTNDTDILTISTDGTQTISTLLDESAYDIDITTQPDTPNQVCSFEDADAGTLAGADVTINVTCVTVQYDISVGVTGLATGNTVVLQNNAGDDLNAGNGISTFTTAIDDGNTYNVTVSNQPTTPEQTCDVTNGSDTVNGADVVNVTVSCTTNTYFVGGDVSGLLKNSVLVLDLNNQESEVVTCNGPFVFDTPLSDESNYSVTVMMNPESPLQTCEVTMGTGTINGDDVIDVGIMCEFMTDMDYLFSDGFDGSPFCVPE